MFLQFEDNYGAIMKSEHKVTYKTLPTAEYRDCLAETTAGLLLRATSFDSSTTTVEGLETITMLDNRKT